MAAEDEDEEEEEEVTRRHRGTKSSDLGPGLLVRLLHSK